MSQHKFQRRWRNYLVTPSFQLKVMFYFWVSGVAVLGSFTYLVFEKIELIRLNAVRAEVVDLKLLATLNESQQDIAFLIPIVLGIFTIVAFIYTIIITHRMAGPILAIQAYVRDLIKGDYDAKRTLRKYDEFKPLMDLLKELAAALKVKDQKKHSSQND